MAETKTKKSSRSRSASTEKKIGTSVKDTRTSLAANGKPGEARNGFSKSILDKATARKREITLKAFRAAYETHHRKAS